MSSDPVVLSVLIKAEESYNRIWDPYHLATDDYFFCLGSTTTSCMTPKVMLWEVVWFANHFVFSLDGPSPHSMTSFLKETCRKSHDFLLHFCQKCSGLFRWFPSMGSTKFFFFAIVNTFFLPNAFSINEDFIFFQKSEKFKLLKVFYYVSGSKSL